MENCNGLVTFQEKVRLCCVFKWAEKNHENLSLKRNMHFTVYLVSEYFKLITFYLARQQRPHVSLLSCPLLGLASSPKEFGPAHVQLILMKNPKPNSLSHVHIKLISPSMVD